MKVKDILDIISKSQSIKLKIPRFKDIDLASDEISYYIETQSYGSKDDIPSKYFGIPISGMSISDNIISLLLDVTPLFLDVDAVAKIYNKELTIHITEK
jgi:hypothetical protein